MYGGVGTRLLCLLHLLIKCIVTAVCALLIIMLPCLVIFSIIHEACDIDCVSFKLVSYLANRYPLHQHFHL